MYDEFYKSIHTCILSMFFVHVRNPDMQIWEQSKQSSTSQ